MNTVVDQETRIVTGGDTVAGKVTLNIPVLRLSGYEEVHVSLRAQIITTVRGHREEVSLVHETIGIWHDPPVKTESDNDIHMREIPWTFTLPDLSLPSRKVDIPRSRDGAYVVYFVETVSVNVKPRKTAVRSNVLPYMPPHDRGAGLSEVLLQGWTGPWRTFEESKAIREGLLFKFTPRFLDRLRTQATVSFSLPDIDIYPISTQIPYKLTIVLSTTARSQPAADRLIDLDFTIVRDIHIKAQSKQRTLSKVFVKRVASLGPSAERYPDTRVVMEEGPWLPEYDDQKRPIGAWKRECHVKSSIEFNTLPSFQSRTLDEKLFAQIAVAGIGRKPETILTVPVDVVSNRRRKPE